MERERRIYKDGVDFWNIDVDFFQNRKVRLIQGEFGVKGVYVLIRILTEIYRTSGYFIKWDDDACYLLSDSTGADSGCSSQFIAEAVQGFLRRSFFDKGVFEKFGVLTSAEVQRRFLRIVKNSRENIFMIREYFLLNPSDRKDVTEATLKKIAFSSIASKENAENLKVFGRNFKVSGKEQNSKEENSTVQNSTEADGASTPPQPPLSAAPPASPANSAYDYFRNYINPSAPERDFQELAEFVRFFNEHGGEGNAVAIYACQIAQSKRAFKWSFIRTVLNGWKSAGVYTLAQCEAHERDWKERRLARGAENAVPSAQNAGTPEQSADERWGIRSTLL